MPPALQLSEDESAGESIPFNDAEEQQQVSKKPDMPSDVDEDDNDSGEEGDDVLWVMSLRKMWVATSVFNLWSSPLRNIQGTLLFQVKWKGYEDPQDQTLEPEENLVYFYLAPDSTAEGAADVVKEYFSIIGGRPEKPSKKRKSITGSTPTHDTSIVKRSKKSRDSEANGTPEIENNVADWVPKTKNWDSQVKSIDTIMRDPPTGNLFVYLNWNNDKKAKVSIQQCYEKCPQKMLQFYEQHLVFKDA
ncbi:heterochromatin protein HP1 [Histoplasma capsulatum G186AR]|uniref:Heterochromatin protein HP1 n=1 Tax=Ajellomyces capsulatus (strain G186AR / H82 / ATCC MYA-2454 / RMSCC 2432) TaxID=447093 RepID=C0NI74_AJECG|nr:heterochromatin protein HP1 [Histoplasma capsulatum G186AR]EEH09509.1 heterochromatin protein HP1 [Histoplasma capsulatum G186AR]